MEQVVGAFDSAVGAPAGVVPGKDLVNPVDDGVASSQQQKPGRNTSGWVRGTALLAVYWVVFVTASVDFRVATLASIPYCIVVYLAVARIWPLNPSPRSPSSE